MRSGLDDIVDLSRIRGPVLVDIKRNAPSHAEEGTTNNDRQTSWEIGGGPGENRPTPRFIHMVDHGNRSSFARSAPTLLIPALPGPG